MSENTENTAPDLLPCPFCGTEPRMRKRWDESLYSHAAVEYLTIVCDGCDCQSMDGENHEEVIAAWNQRAPVEALEQPAAAPAAPAAAGQGAPARIALNLSDGESHALLLACSRIAMPDAMQLTAHSVPTSTLLLQTMRKLRAALTQDAGDVGATPGPQP